MTGASATSGRRLVVEADGGSRGNPGVAGYGALVRDAATGAVLVELAEPLGQQSNNVAEYSGLVAGLTAAAELATGPHVVARLDSKLVVEQMSGRWKIKHEDMRRLALEAREVVRRIADAGGSVQFEWVPREKNKAADALSNDAMDGKSVRRVLEGGAGSEGADASVVLEHAADAAGAVAASASSQLPGGASTRPLRLLLVQVPYDESVGPRIARAVQRLVGEDARVVGSAEPPAAALAEAVGAALDASVDTTDAWDGTAPGEGADDAVRGAYRGLRAEGGTVVVVTSRRGVLSVLGDVLATPTERFWALATAPGSLSAVEVWEDGSASVAFTNRTDHLA
ncbi:reverse transcriptase-like protein [Intrasporangium sp. YIM S08009]|uniref:reverse transcriptase-like protein n=1 Tax=Intrasporangium zincisolvens TaxID=3080018 RepID=UPI002B05BF42|nr:reverse transcriptase-like protein [Intrasporangium sp. YIM S08009]